MITLVKKKALTAGFFPFNHYRRYIGLPTYRQGRKLGLNVFLSLWFCPTILNLLIVFIDILIGRVMFAIVYILAFNTIHAFCMLIVHRGYTSQRKLVIISRRLDDHFLEIHRKVKFFCAKEINDNKDLQDQSDRIDKILEDMQNNKMQF